MAGIKKVTMEHFSWEIMAHRDEEYTLTLKAWQVAVLHGLIALIADHPGIKQMHNPTHDVIKLIRDWCKDKFAGWGFSPEEVEYLDSMRGDAIKGK